MPTRTASAPRRTPLTRRTPSKRQFWPNGPWFNSREPSHAAGSIRQKAQPELSAVAVLGGGGIAVPDSAVHGGGGIAVPEITVVGGGGMAVPQITVVGGAGIAVPNSAVVGGGGIAVPQITVVGGAGMAVRNRAVLGGGGMKDPASAVAGGGGMAVPVSAVTGGGGIAEPVSTVLGGGGITDSSSAVIGGGMTDALAPNLIPPWCVFFRLNASSPTCDSERARRAAADRYSQWRVQPVLPAELSPPPAAVRTSGWRSRQARRAAPRSRRPGGSA
jgi:hypothetical protein